MERIEDIGSIFFLRELPIKKLKAGLPSLTENVLKTRGKRWFSSVLDQKDDFLFFQYLQICTI